MTSDGGAILGRNEGRFLRGSVGNYRIKIGVVESAGSLSVVESEILPGARTLAHYHLKIYEAVFISEGELRVRVGDAWTTQTAGATVLLPVGVVHAWENRVGSRPGCRSSQRPPLTDSSRRWPHWWRGHLEASPISSRCASSTGGGTSCSSTTDHCEGSETRLQAFGKFIASTKRSWKSGCVASERCSMERASRSARARSASDTSASWAPRAAALPT